MSATVTTHLNFKCKARQALTFYKSVFGGQLSVVTYADAHDAGSAEAPDDVMWGQLLADSGFRIMAYDVQSAKSWHPGENAMYVVVEETKEDNVVSYWSKLIEQAEIIQPLQPSPWSPLSGMVKDQFGVVWVLSLLKHV
ncbi:MULTISPECIES: VOC family protein [unclassified Pantoea]|uniref:VOC family protein n=1 Tax=unclassified Pantoea TaxID=2630326 RepID=UPI001CD27DC2|nr:MULTISPECIES: VOC family protein [unclassified Pantoea]MCA1177574.1 VOC family protein [Pantoea sp. alder69]MCA1249520.1 VOC family protein [Pantoea sp. alder70]MCA1266063.1 VOC family protein [Pantoea sp. alder81]